MSGGGYARARCAAFMGLGLLREFHKAGQKCAQNLAGKKSNPEDIEGDVGPACLCDISPSELSSTYEGEKTLPEKVRCFCVM